MTHAQEQQVDREREGQWHLDKKVPLGLIVALMFQGALGIWAIADIKKDVEILKSIQVIQLDRDSRQDKTASDAVGLVREDIKEVKGMIARLIDKEDKSHK